MESTSAEISQVPEGGASYDDVHMMIEEEETRKKEIENTLSELDNREREMQERLSALRAHNINLEREINEWKAKLRSLEGNNHSQPDTRDDEFHVPPGAAGLRSSVGMSVPHRLC